MKQLLSVCLLMLWAGIAVSQTADEFFSKKDYHNASVRYEMEVKSNPEAWFNLGQSYFALKQFDKAVMAFKNYRDLFSGADKEKANKLIELLEREDDYVELVNVGPVINTKLAEAVPRISQDEKVLYFKSVDREGGSGAEDIWYSQKGPDGQWQKPVPFDALNTSSSEALYSMGGGNNVAILFGNYPGSFGNGDLFYSVKSGMGWTQPCNLGATINSSAWESQASLAPDGRTLFFCSGREGGQGGTDIYVTVLSDNGWSTPENLGPVINTPKGEYRPTLAADGKTLYFASYGHFGFGETDIFVARKNGPTWQDWTKPVNLGKYINTLDSDEDLSLPNSGIRAYTVKFNAVDGYGDYDIYSFILPPSMRPEMVFKVHGRVVNENDSAISAIIRYYDSETGKEMAKAVSSTDGFYEIALPSFHKYNVVIDMKGYLYYSEVLDLTNPQEFQKKATLSEKLRAEQANLQKARLKFDEYNRQFDEMLQKNTEDIYDGFRDYEHLAELYRINANNMDMAIKRAKLNWLGEENTDLNIERNYQLTTIQIGAKFELKNIFFDFGKATLTDESKTELDKLVDIMNRSDIIIELGGHTDNVGSAESNKALSQDRVNSVREYLIANGVDQGRIAAVGYGEERPVADNETEEGRQKNRRVEVQITDIKPREGKDIVTAADLKKEDEEPEEFDFLSTLSYAARKGGLPDDSPCKDGVSYAVNNTANKINTKIDLPKNQADRLTKDNYMLKSFNGHFMSFGYKPYGGISGAGLILMNKNLREIHAEYLFMGNDYITGQASLGLLWAIQFTDVLNIPLSMHYGVDLNVALTEQGDNIDESKGFWFYNIPVGFRYTHHVNDDLHITPEIMYYFGNKVKDAGDAKSKYLRLGVNARWKFLYGGAFLNKGPFVDYFGIRAGLAL